jgi:acetophenone carboxylase
MRHLKEHGKYLQERMKAGDPSVTLDHRFLFEQRDIKGDWKFELIARTPDIYHEGDLLFGFSGGGPGMAENVYRVVADPDRLKLDGPRTEEARAAERKARLARGGRYDEFISEWSKQSPPQEILQWYGSWPDAKPTGPIFRP